MFKMKRLISLALAGVLAMSMTACSKSGKDDDDDDDKKSSKSSGYEDVIENCFQFLETGRSKYLKKCYIKETWNYVYGDDEEAFEEEMASTFEDLRDEFGDNYKISYKITDKEELDDDDLEEIKERYVEYVGVDEDAKFDKGYEIWVDYTIKGNGEEEENDAYFCLIRIDNEWDMYEVEGIG